jgi:hypothetical protein
MQYCHKFVVSDIRPIPVTLQLSREQKSTEPRSRCNFIGLQDFCGLNCTVNLQGKEIAAIAFVSSTSFWRGLFCAVQCHK